MLRQTYYPLLFMVFVFILSSCGDDEFSIEGTWAIKSANLAGCADPELNTSFENTPDGLCFEIDGLKSCLVAEIKFNSDGTYDAENLYSVTEGGFMLSDREEESGTWTYSDDILTICDESGDCEAVAISSTSNEFTITDYDDDLECSVRILFEKQ